MQDQMPGALNPQQVIDVQKKLQLEARFRSGINWFYWIAGLSLVNSIAYLAGTTWTFVIGLGATQVIDGLASGLSSEIPSSAMLIKVIGVVFDLAIAGVFVLLGLLGRSRKKAAIIAGGVLYILDGILLLAFQDWLGAAFHAWALFGIFNGLRALGELERIEGATAPAIGRAF